MGNKRHHELSMICAKGFTSAQYQLNEFFSFPDVQRTRPLSSFTSIFFNKSLYLYHTTKTNCLLLSPVATSCLAGGCPLQEAFEGATLKIRKPALHIALKPKIHGNPSHVPSQTLLCFPQMKQNNCLHVHTSRKSVGKPGLS